MNIIKHNENVILVMEGKRFITLPSEVFEGTNLSDFQNFLNFHEIGNLQNNSDTFFFVLTVFFTHFISLFFEMLGHFSFKGRETS